ncbi:MAG: tRNA-dihydrouridine synthase [Gammaproteobacteria bacterium]|nr:tRNA-dihydrouridine synthase [Gammaproteobacteria bacterium]
MSNKLTELFENNFPIALAPMAGVTDLPFRSLCESLGADYSVTEMAASAPQLLDSDKNQSRLHFTSNARVKILQIIGNDAEHMSCAAEHYASLGADIIDINFGCPAKKVSSKGAGSALLSDLDSVQNILSMVVQRCSVPVTLKTRLGTDHDNYTLLKVGEIALKLGVELITVHGRTRACKFRGEAQFSEVAKLKQMFPELRVVANGDIDSVPAARAVKEQTNCDGLMIGRGAVGNPWLFSDIKVGERNSLVLSSRILDTIIEHVLATHVFYGEAKGVRFARKHIQAYLQYLGISDVFDKIAKIDSAEEQIDILYTELQSHFNE